MFPPPGQATATPPMPPEIQQQQAQQPVGQMFAQMGQQVMGGIPDPLALLEAQVAKLESFLGDTLAIINQVNPAWSALLVPIAQSGKALQSEISDTRQRTSGPSPQVTGSVPPNVPGNISGAQPAM